MIDVVTIDEQTIRLVHERVPDRPMEVWTRPGPHATPAGMASAHWFWNLSGGRVLGNDPNMLVAIEKAMTALSKMVDGDPNE